MKNVISAVEARQMMQEIDEEKLNKIFLSVKNAVVHNANNCAITEALNKSEKDYLIGLGYQIQDGSSISVQKDGVYYHMIW